ncbi:GNAT family N-acetyltransferase [Nocardia mangyaensis]|uniref:GNAT family N-acetyltransferase n=1 Tax=Nocardia mangyaensis TaxID=2213200 RepID=UPI00267645F8|nr:GNAT family N-acetyltransferase [Nocardia mangyaensis]MDO3645420.1 GNAT family N-acetyltransferase [Nocardia mangyaensis]
MRIDITSDAARFFAEARALLRGDPLRHTVIATTAVNQAEGRSGAMATRFLTVRDGETVGLAMCTQGSVYLGELPADSVPAVADAFVADGVALRSVEGAVADADAFAAHWSAVGDGSYRRRYSTRLLRLGELRVPGAENAPQVSDSDGSLRVPMAAGAPRRATVADAAVCLELVQEFAAKSGSPLRLDETAVRRRVESGWWWLWEHAGRPVTLVARQAAVLGWARIGPVYTPPGLRGNGFASALTATVAAEIRAEGADACLFTDLANPTSNKIYQAIGFEPVRDFVHHTLSPDLDR